MSSLAALGGQRTQATHEVIHDPCHISLVQPRQFKVTAEGDTCQCDSCRDCALLTSWRGRSTLRMCCARQGLSKNAHCARSCLHRMPCTAAYQLAGKEGSQCRGDIAVLGQKGPGRHAM